jgi:predicted O-methyltransferase YrrM
VVEGCGRCGPTNDVNDAWWASVNFSQVKERFFTNALRYGVLPILNVLQMDSEAAFEILKTQGRRFDLIHIDGAHSPERSLRDVTAWSTLVRKGGLVIFDDIAWPSVKQAREYLTNNLRVIDEVIESDNTSYGAYEV